MKERRAVGALRLKGGLTDSITVPDVEGVELHW
jgi:hypothetical protein